jgi:cytochrome c oxidase assembly protein subunit 15
MGILSATLAAWLWRTEARAWLRGLSYFAVGLVVAQGVVGGLRVLLDRIQVGALDTSLGQLIAMLHACLAQAFACVLLALAVSCSRGWISRDVPVGARVRRIGVACCALIFVQLAIGAVVRHSFAGLAIPTFPWSTAQGDLLPAAWSIQVAVQFAHRAMACVIAVAVVAFAAAIWRDGGSPAGMRAGASALVSLVALQILLGASIIRTYRAVAVTTGHVLVGALTLVTAFWLTWLAHRDAIERSPAP